MYGLVEMNFFLSMDLVVEQVKPGTLLSPLVSHTISKMEGMYTGVQLKRKDMG